MKSQFQVVNRSDISSMISQKEDTTPAQNLKIDNAQIRTGVRAIQSVFKQMNKKFSGYFDSFFEAFLDEFSKIENSFKVEVKEKLDAREKNPFDDPIDTSIVDKNLMNLKRHMMKSKFSFF